jgi:hypothetical protein
MLIDEVPFLLWYYSFLGMPLLNLSKLAFIVFIIWNKDESDIIELLGSYLIMLTFNFTLENKMFGHP